MKDEKIKHRRCCVCGEPDHGGEFCIKCGNSEWEETDKFCFIMIDPPENICVCKNEECGFDYYDGCIFTGKRYCPMCGNECTVTKIAPRMS